MDVHTNNKSLISHDNNIKYRQQSQSQPQLRQRSQSPNNLSPNNNPSRNNEQIVENVMEKNPVVYIQPQQPRFQLVQQPEYVPQPVPIQVPVHVPIKKPKISKSNGIKFAINQTTNVDTLIKKKNQNLEKRAKDALMDFDVIFYQFKTIEKNMYDYDVK